jgi:hypothetical protein
MTGSVHLQRKQAIADTAFNHELHDVLNDVASDDSDDESPELKNVNFEFTNSYHIMRLIRMILFIQTIAIAIDNPSIQLALYFDICCKGVLSYSLHFYSRPFLDILYVIQYFWHEITLVTNYAQTPKTPSNIEVGRRLNVNP